MNEPGISQVALPGGVTATTVSGSQPGPVLALLGGVHGDEDEGVLAVHRVVGEAAGVLLKGTVRAVAPANPAAWAARSRVSPLDGGNLARCFPGVSDDGPTAAVAAAITAGVIAGSEALIDLHSAGVAYAMPTLAGWCAGIPVSDRSLRLAEAFGAPVIWQHPAAAPGRSLTAAADLGVPAIYAECAGGGGIRGSELDVYVSGVLSVMASLGMLPPSYSVRSAPPRRVTGQGDLDSGVTADRDGFFVSSADAGDIVTSGGELGRFYGYDGDLLDTVTAPIGGMVMFLRRQARTRAGDVLYVLAEVDEAQEVTTGPLLPADQSRPEEAVR